MASLVAIIPAPARAQSLDTTCQLALAQLDPQTANTLFVDESAVYWLAAYQAVPGTRIRISGEFPRSRYTSFNLYDVGGRPIDSLADVQIEPDAGSTNPFLPGADRLAADRGYTAFVEFGPRPANPAPNTMYAGTLQGGAGPNFNGTLWYRVYIPDAGLGDDGGVGLPRIALERDPGGPAVSPPDCHELIPPSTGAVNDLIAGLSTPDIPGASVGYPGRNPPAWRRFVNLANSTRDYMADNEFGDQTPANQIPLPQSPGIFDNRDIAYMTAPTSQGHGNVLALRGRAPSFADTRGGPALMPSGSQLRYFSFCEYEPASQRMIDCLADDQVVVDEDGFYTIVVSTPEHRPAAARPECGVTWLAWGPAKHGLVIYRHMLADPGFAGAINNVDVRGEEQAAMGEFYPAGAYYPDATAFPDPGCPAGKAKRPKKPKKPKPRD